MKEGATDKTLREQAERLHNQYRDGLDSVCQRQEKRVQEIHKYYRKKEQQWQREQTVVNNPPMRGGLTNVWLRELPRAPAVQPSPRARDFQSARTDHEEDTGLMGADPQLSTNVRI